MSVLLKPGVQFAVIAPAGFLILQALKAASVKLGQDLTITSGTDGEHSGPRDPHKTGEAYDVRSQDFPRPLRVGVLATIMFQIAINNSRLDPDRFFGLLEAPGTDNEHFHIQRTKNTTFGVEDFLAS